MKVGFLNKQSSKVFELIFISSFWVLLFTLPLVFQWINKHTINWELIFNIWIDYLPLLIIFCVNRYVLIHKFLFKSRLLLYLFFVTILIALIVFCSIKTRQKLNPQKNIPQHGQALLQLPDSNKAIKPREHRQQKAPMSTYPPYVNLILLSILLVGFDTGMKLSVNWAQTLQQKAEVEKENIKNELAFLRNQISPHFLMNTLNNIHSLVDFDTKEAKSAIAKLSVLMRHLLYESDENPTALYKEINFIESYIKLMQLRFSDEVEIKMELPAHIPDITIPPLLFTNILENAFKYGISYNDKSFVHIKINSTITDLEFSVKNSIHKKSDNTENAGIGIKNTKKRLQLIYNQNYTYTYSDTGNVFSAIIKIPI